MNVLQRPFFLSYTYKNNIKMEIKERDWEAVDVTYVPRT